MIRSETRRIWWATCSASDCVLREPSERDEVDGWPDEAEAWNFALDCGWIPAPDGRLFCPTHGDQLCRLCSRWIGERAEAWDWVCAVCRAAGRAGEVMAAPAPADAERLRAQVVTTVTAPVVAPVERINTIVPRSFTARDDGDALVVLDEIAPSRRRGWRLSRGDAVLVVLVVAVAGLAVVAYFHPESMPTLPSLPFENPL